MVKIADHDITRHYEGVAVDFHISKHLKKSAYQSWTDGSDHREDKFKSHWDGEIISPMKKDSTNNVYSGAIGSWKDGENASSDDVEAMMKISQKLSPEELKEAEKNGLLQEGEADALIMVGALMVSGKDEKGNLTTSVADIQDAMNNFYALDKADQNALVTLMSDRDVNHSVMENLHSGRNDDSYDFTDEMTELNGQQMRAAVFLTEAKPAQLGNLRQFIDFDYSADDYKSVSDLKNLDNWGVLGDKWHNDLSDMVKSLPDKTQHEAAIEGYGHSYNLTNSRQTKDDNKESVLNMKTSVDGAVTDIEAKLDRGEDITLLSPQDMRRYLQDTVPGYSDMSIDVKNALAEYALREVSEHTMAQMTGPDGTMNRDGVTAYCASHVDGWANLSEAEQAKIVDSYMNASDMDVGVDDNGNYVKTTYNTDGTTTQTVVGRTLTPGDLRGAGLDENGTMDIGTLMFLVLMDREDSQQELIRGYADDVDDKNQDVKNATKALSTLRAQDSDSTVDIEDLKFTSQSGQEISVFDYCKTYGVDIPQDSRGNPETDLDKTGLQNLIDSIKSSSDTMTTDAQSALQKLQQAIDRMTNTNSLVSNFESTWTSMQKGNINNMNVR